jgi:hypothetical protein
VRALLDGSPAAAAMLDIISPRFVDPAFSPRHAPASGRRAPAQVFARR